MHAQRVLGQPNFEKTTPGQSQDTFSSPNGLASDGNSLFISEYSNRRILVYKNFPLAGLSKADFVIGQSKFTTNNEENSEKGFSGPGKILFTEGKLIITDYSFNRAVIYRSPIISNAQNGETVIGQPDFHTTKSGTSAATFDRPVSAATDGVMLFISDYGNNRILGYRTIPKANGNAADIVLGQSDFFGKAPGVGPDRLKMPQGVYISNHQLYIADSGNNRVLVFNSLPHTSLTEPDFVLGQPDYYSNSPGSGRNRFHEPDSILVYQNHLFISDLKNHRVLIWKDIPSNGKAPADIVLGQKDFDTVEPGSGPDHFFMPRELLVHNDELYVADRGNNRIIIFSLSTIFDQQP